MNLTSLLSPAGNPVSPADPLSVQLITSDPTGAVGVSTVLPVILEPGPGSGVSGFSGGSWVDTVLFTMTIGAAIQNRLWGWAFEGVASSAAAAGLPIVHEWRFSLKGVTSGKILVLGAAAASNGPTNLTTGTTYYFPISGGLALSAPFSLLSYFSTDSQLQGLAELNSHATLAASIWGASLNLFTSAN